MTETEETAPEMITRKQQSGEPWTQQEVTYALAIPFEDVNPMVAWEDADLNDVASLCGLGTHRVEDCISCRAGWIQENRDDSEAWEDIKPLTPDTHLEPMDDGHIPESLPVSDDEPDIKDDFLAAVDDVRRLAVMLFNTGVTLGPVTGKELLNLVSGADRYLRLVDSMIHSGIHHTTESEQREIEILSATIQRIKG